MQKLDNLLGDLNSMARMEQFGGDHYTDKKIQDVRRAVQRVSIRKCDQVPG